MRVQTWPVSGCRAGLLTTSGGFDLNHVSPEPGQCLGAGRPCLELRQVDDADSAQSGVLPVVRFS